MSERYEKEGPIFETTTEQKDLYTIAWALSYQIKSEGCIAKLYNGIYDKIQSSQWDEYILRKPHLLQFNIN